MKNVPAIVVPFPNTADRIPVLVAPLCEGVVSFRKKMVAASSSDDGRSDLARNLDSVTCRVVNCLASNLGIIWNEMSLGVPWRVPLLLYRRLRFGKHAFPQRPTHSFVGFRSRISFVQPASQGRCEMFRADAYEEHMPKTQSKVFLPVFHNSDLRS